MKRHPKLHLIAAGLLAVLSVSVVLAGDLVPLTVTHSCYRTTSGASMSGTFYRGNSVRGAFTLFSDATGVTTQSLADCTVAVVLGNASATSNVTATVSNAAAGLISFDWTVLTNNTATQYAEISVTDTGQTPNVIFTYPLYGYVTKARLGD